MQWSKSIARLVAFFMAIALSACGGGTETVGGNTTQTPTLVAQTLAAQTALTIDSQPVDQTITAGQTATFSVTATGTGPLTYQWKKNGVNITGGTGATSNTYTTPAMGYAGNGAVYSVVVSNSAGTVTSRSATLTLNKTSTLQSYGLVANASDGLYDKTECVQDNTTGLMWEGKTASPATSRLGILTYFNYDSTSSAQKWNGSAYVNPTQAEIDAGTNSIGYRNSVNASALCGYTDWRLPTKEELEGIVLRGTSPAIDTMWFPNTQARFYWSSSPYVGNSGSAWGVNFDYGNVNFTGRSLNLRVRLVRNSAAPSIATQPRAQTVTAGQTATFSVTATGIAPLTYQWRKNGTNISAATSSSYTTPATAIGDSGAVFTVVVSNSVGTVTSSSATLTVSTSRYSLVANASGGTYDKTECVQDNTTGLMWEGKTASPATSRLGILTYFNYDSTSSAQKWNGSAYVNPTQAEIDAGTNSIGYRNSVNASALCGYTDWRLPTKEELEGIVLRGTSPAIDTVWFPNTQARFYWSSSPYVGNSGSAWGVNFDYGNVNFTGRSLNLRVRLVRNSAAPSIATQPTAQTVTAGQTATFSVTATGTAPLTYQWRKNGTNISGATSSSYTTPATAIGDSGAVFTVVVSNSVGTVTSSSAMLTVNRSSATGYSEVPNSSGGNYARTECVLDNSTGLIWEGKTASPATSRLGISTYTNYDDVNSAQKWNGSNFVNPTPAEIDAGTNSIGYRNSVNASALCGYTDWRLPTKDELLGVVASGGSTRIDTTWFPNTQANWYWSSSPYMGSSSSVWDVYFDNFGVYSGSGDRYGTNHVRLVRNSGGSSPPAGTPAPAISTQPASQTVTAGQTATFSVTATGTAPLSYQWRKNGTNISGATSSSYTTPAISSADNGAVFTVVVSNSTGTVTSNNATITVTNARYSLVANASGGTYALTECVKDTTTGLIWEGKTASPATSRLGTSIYTNYDDVNSAQKWDGSNFVNPTPAEIDAGTNSIGYRNSVNASALCGYTDWRLPTKDELLGVVASGGSTRIDTTWFPNTLAYYYWTSSPYVGYSSYAWNVYFSDGNVSSNYRGYGFAVRLVRASQ